jgi:hypothetical protein
MGKISREQNEALRTVQDAVQRAVTLVGPEETPEEKD